MNTSPRRPPPAGSIGILLVLLTASTTSCGSSGNANGPPNDAGGQPETGSVVDSGGGGEGGPVEAGGEPIDGAADSGAGADAGADAGPPVPNPIPDGPVRFTVISPTLIRAEYAVDRAFTDATTFTAVARPLATTGFTTSVVNGWRVVTTDKMTVSYQEGSGRFGAANLTLTLAGSPGTTRNPLFRNAICPQGQLCEAESAALGGGARSVSNHVNYSGVGFVDTWQPGATATWTVQGVTPGNVDLQVRYANATGGSATIGWKTASGAAGSLALGSLADWDTWGVSKTTFSAPGATFALTVTCTASALCPVNVDAISVTPVGAPFPAVPPSSALGGWRRALDGFSGSGALNQGMLSRDGWYLLDDGQTALWNADGSTFPAARPHADVDHQDGYVFGYGSDYAQGLADFIAVTGAPPMLPRYAFGVMFSEYFAYHDTDWENTNVPAFRAHTTPLDVIGVDTDWKAPSNWNGWSWNATYFPDPPGFATWMQGQKLHALLNIHPSIESNDPLYAGAAATAGGLDDAGYPGDTTRMAFDLGKQAHVNAFAALHKPLLDLGFIPWLDWCCDQLDFSVPGLTPDGWVNELYASWPIAAGRRGFAWSRAGGLLGPSGYPGGNDDLYPTGPWADHRTTVQFTGDTYGTWEMLQYEIAFTAAEASIGLPYVSHDIGSFHATHLADDLYARWVQFGAFQPALRLHSDHGDRLPWQYGPLAEASGEAFLRLREEMLPYNYTLGWQAHTTGAGMARPLWYVFPDQADAFTNAGEYMWGDSLLVAPVTLSGAAPTATVWFPPGHWIAFADAGLPAETFDGPGTFPVPTTLASMPVFARAGAIVPMQSYTDDAATAPATLEPRVFGASANGQFTLYEDEGEGLGFQSGQSATTLMTVSAKTFTIGAMSGTYPGAPASRAYRVVWADVDAPAGVSVNGAAIPAGAAEAGAGDGWSYDASTRTAVIRLSARAVGTPLAIQLM